MAPSSDHPTRKRGLMWALVLFCTIIFTAALLIFPTGHDDDGAGGDAGLLGGFLGALPGASDGGGSAGRARKPKLSSTDKTTLRYKRQGAVVGHAEMVAANSLRIDGQTFVLFGLYVPAPETQCAVTGQPWPCGEHALAALSEILAQSTLVACFDKGTDPLGRTVAQCRIGHNDIGGMLLKEGWAIANPRLSLSYRNVESMGRSAQNGIWRGTFNPQEFVGY